MTVTTDVQSIVYDTDGSTADFPIPFYFLRDTDITAELVDAEDNLTELVLGSDFTVTGAGQPSGGTLTATTLFASGLKLHVYRVVPVTQESQYQQNDPFPAKTTEKALDKLTMLVQQQKQTTDRALVVPRSDLNPQTTLPSARLRANKALGFDSAGNPVAIDLTIGSILVPVVHSIAMLRLVSKVLASDVLVTSYYGDGDTRSRAQYQKAYNLAPAGWENGGSQIVAADGAGWQLLRERFSVCNFGAGAGLGNDTAAISACVKASPAGNSQALQNPLNPSSDWTEVEIPFGHFTPTDYIDTGGKEVNYLVHPGAVIDNPQYLNGRITRLGSKTGDFHHGITDSATTLAVTANRRADEQAQVSGFPDPSYMSKGNGRDSVTLYVGNRVPTAQYGAAAVTSYSAGGVVLSTPMSDMYLKQMRKGMIVRTRHTPQAYQGMVTDWTANSISVSAWYLIDGSTSGVPTTPPGTAGLDVNAFRKAWTINANMIIDGDSSGSAVTGMELGVQNTKGEAQSRGGPIEANAYYATNLDTAGAYYLDAGFLAAGRMSYGFKANGGVTYAFYADASVNPVGDAPAALIYAKDITGTPYFHVKPDGTMEIGKRGNAGAMTLDLHSGTVDTDYDVRLQSSGGTGTAGGGTCTLYAAAILLNATGNVTVATTFRPSTDNNLSNGDSTHRWGSVWVGSGVISTSDARQKTEVVPLTGDEIAAGLDLAREIGGYEFLASVAAKGDAARTHIGMTVQRAIEILQSRGLDPMRYAFICHDTWEATPAMIDDSTGDILEPARNAGDLYSFRPDELHAFILRALAADRDALAVRVAALETKTAA